MSHVPTSDTAAATSSFFFFSLNGISEQLGTVRLPFDGSPIHHCSEGFFIPKKQQQKIPPPPPFFSSQKRSLPPLSSLIFSFGVFFFILGFSFQWWSSFLSFVPLLHAVYAWVLSVLASTLSSSLAKRFGRIVSCDHWLTGSDLVPSYPASANYFLKLFFIDYVRRLKRKKNWNHHKSHKYW